MHCVERDREIEREREHSIYKFRNTAEVGLESWNT